MLHHRCKIPFPACTWDQHLTRVAADIAMRNPPPATGNRQPAAGNRPSAMPQLAFSRFAAKFLSTLIMGRRETGEASLVFGIWYSEFGICRPCCRLYYEYGLPATLYTSTIVAHQPQLPCHPMTHGLKEKQEKQETRKQHDSSRSDDIR